MTEREWVKTIIPGIEEKLQQTKDKSKITVVETKRLSYSHEILTYNDDDSAKDLTQNVYESEILIYEQFDIQSWKPRVVIEAKLGSLSTLDAITYSQKAQTHKYVHPYLRFGMLIRKREDYPLLGRLFRHGQHFDFML